MEVQGLVLGHGDITVSTEIVATGKGCDVMHQPGRNRNGWLCDV